MAASPRQANGTKEGGAMNWDWWRILRYLILFACVLAVITLVVYGIETLTAPDIQQMPETRG